jgi:arrestin-related trafficking adapter 3/6
MSASIAAANAVSSSALPAAPQAAHVHTIIPRSTDSPTLGVNAEAAASRSTLSTSPVHRIWEQESANSRPQSTIFPDAYQSARPIHLMRVPSYNPPAFDADEPPPPLPQDLMTPPPHYDMIIGTPSVDGLADYFQRLADYNSPEPTLGESDADMRTIADNSDAETTHAADSPSEETETEDDSDSSEEARGPTRIAERGGRVNVANPRTPGGRPVPSRSFEIERPVFNLSMAGVVRRGG